jgi:nitrite reductase/ring-hydroxylating ferredoxin subunit
MARVRVAGVDEVAEGGQKFVRVEGRALYLSRVGGRFFAAESSCPCPLSGGVLNRIVEHGGHPCVECDARCYTLAFDLETGRNVRGFNFAIDVFPARVEDGAVFVDLSRSESRIAAPGGNGQ